MTGFYDVGVAVERGEVVAIGTKADVGVWAEDEECGAVDAEECGGVFADVADGRRVG